MLILGKQVTFRGLVQWGIRYIRRHWWLDRVCVAFLVCLVIVFGLSYYFMNVMANVASQRSKKIQDELGQRPTLPDVGFEMISYFKKLWLTDLFDILMFIPTILLIICHQRPWRVISRTLLSWALASLIRITTVAITSVPDPRPDCEYVVGNVFTHFTLHRCGDAIYSGHTLIYIICGMVWASFSPRRWPWRLACFLVWCGAIAGSLIVLGNRAHYSIDVLLAWYIASGSWYVVAWFWYWQVTKKGRLLKIEFPMGVGRHSERDSNDLVHRRRLELGLDENGKPFDVTQLLVFADNVWRQANIPPPRPSTDSGRYREKPDDQGNDSVLPKTATPFEPVPTTRSISDKDFPGGNASLGPERIV
ncbi:hypothetical protein EV182_005564 [Spiromyces aspiralis]|uniref:Uncharacterized protein n=1 Tax=Spiromyces aspiralis TaxID=68401 RepID=A0ACC1HD62_9FUNG|nr:hypothetical protein EV182_005564 [Spiromyces aspiralis]